MTERITMHHYGCPGCGLHWFQEHFFPNEWCIHCGEKAAYLGAEEHEAPVFGATS